MAKKNHDYGKIINGELVYALNPVTTIIQDDQGNNIEANMYNPSDYYYRTNGYKNIVSEPYPQDGKTYAETLTEDEQTIYRGWQQIIMPPDPPTIEERIDALEDAFLEFIMGE